MYFLVLSIVYFLGALLDILCHFRQSHHQPLPVIQELQSPSEEKVVPVLSMQDGNLHGLQPSALPLPPEDSMEDCEGPTGTGAKA